MNSLPVRDRLSSYFTGVAWKRLSSVETNPDSSHQHEFNGVRGLQELFGSEKVRLYARVLYLGDNEDSLYSIEKVKLTWYDARKDHPERTEYRLYYDGNIGMDLASQGDLLIIAKRTGDFEESVVVIIAKQGSTYEQQLLWLFSIDDESSRFHARQIEPQTDRQIGLAAKWILEELEIVVPLVYEHQVDPVLEEFKNDFPSTAQMSAYTRQRWPRDSREDPDSALLMWIEKEELLFRIIENVKVQAKLQEGFKDVNEFLRFSLSVQNRRKSRAGFALENHLEQIFKDHKVMYSRGVITENKSKPDFLFPRGEDYHDPTFPDHRLTMLGVKSTCKDRWRQVLSEAARIPDKHLLTLEAGISENQTAEMKANRLQLVIPASLHESYRPAQREWLISLKEFILLTQWKQDKKYLG